MATSLLPTAGWSAGARPVMNEPGYQAAPLERGFGRVVVSRVQPALLLDRRIHRRSAIAVKPYRFGLNCLPSVPHGLQATTEI